MMINLTKKNPVSAPVFRYGWTDDLPPQLQKSPFDAGHSHTAVARLQTIYFYFYFSKITPAEIDEINVMTLKLLSII